MEVLANLVIFMKEIYQSNFYKYKSDNNYDFMGNTVKKPALTQFYLDALYQHYLNKGLAESEAQTEINKIRLHTQVPPKEYILSPWLEVESKYTADVEENHDQNNEEVTFIQADDQLISKIHKKKHNIKEEPVFVQADSNMIDKLIKKKKEAL